MTPSSTAAVTVTTLSTLPAAFGHSYSGLDQMISAWNFLALTSSAQRVDEYSIAQLRGVQQRRLNAQRDRP
jgi:hypothetical protein